MNEDHDCGILDTSREKDVAANPETQAFMKAKRAKGFCPMVANEQIGFLVCAFNCHLKKILLWSIECGATLSQVCVPLVYKGYLLKFSNCFFTQDTSKEKRKKLCDAMNEIKTRKSNDDDSKKAYFEDDELLKRFWTTNGHATGNIMKKRQNIIGRCFRRAPPYLSTLIVAPVSMAPDTLSTPATPTITTPLMELVPSKVTWYVEQPPTNNKMLLN